jgi:hypothetical protein
MSLSQKSESRGRVGMPVRSMPWYWVTACHRRRRGELSAARGTVRVERSYLPWCNVNNYYYYYYYYWICIQGFSFWAQPQPLSPRSSCFNVNDFSTPSAANSVLFCFTLPGKCVGTFLLFKF